MGLYPPDNSALRRTFTPRTRVFPAQPKLRPCWTKIKLPLGPAAQAILLPKEGEIQEAIHHPIDPQPALLESLELEVMESELLELELLELEVMESESLELEEEGYRFPLAHDREECALHPVEPTTTILAAASATTIFRVARPARRRFFFSGRRRRFASGPAQANPQATPRENETSCLKRLPTAYCCLLPTHAPSFPARSPKSAACRSYLPAAGSGEATPGPYSSGRRTYAVRNPRFAAASRSHG
jgi:hypothetical protein